MVRTAATVQPGHMVGGRQILEPPLQPSLFEGVEIVWGTLVSSHQLEGTENEDKSKAEAYWSPM